MQQILNDIKSSSNSLSTGEILLDQSRSDLMKEFVVFPTSTEPNSSFSKAEQTMTTNVASSPNYSELFYDMQAKNFDADKVRNLFIETCLLKYIFLSRVRHLYAQYVIRVIMSNRNVLNYLCQT